MKETTKKWIHNLFNPDENPSSASLIALASGLTGVLMAIISIFLNTSETIETSTEMAKWLISLGIGGKTLQHYSRGRK